MDGRGYSALYVNNNKNPNNVATTTRISTAASTVGMAWLNSDPNTRFNFSEIYLGGNALLAMNNINVSIQ